VIDLTARQSDVLRIINLWSVLGIAPPTYASMGRMLGVTKCTVWQHVDALVRRGLVVRVGKGNRNIRLSDRCPTCGAELNGNVPVTVEQP